MHRILNFLTLLGDKLRLLLHKVEVDRAVFLGLLMRCWSIISGIVSLLIIVFKFSPQLQGYYYAFLSIIAFQALAEMGLGNIIIQFSSHEWSKLALDKSGKIIGERRALSRLQSLAQIFLRWYCAASIVLILLLVACGFFIFSKNQDTNINWVLPWISLCICNGMLFCLLPVWSLLEGCNQIMKLYSYKLIQSVFLNVSLWVAILSGAKLWAPVISNLAIIICAAVFILFKCRTFLKTLLFSLPSEQRVNWIKEILPLQWRVATTWLISPLGPNLFVPLLFKYQGPVIAGQMGMTFNLVTAIAMMPSSWLAPKVPQFGMLIAKKKYKDLDMLFWSTTKIFITITLLGAAAAWFIIFILNLLRHPFASRFLPLLTTGIFILAQAVSIMAVPFATYLRIHKKEPLVYISIVSGVLVGLSALFLGKYYSAIGMVAGYLFTILIVIPVTFIIWHRCRKEWHKYGLE